MNARPYPATRGGGARLDGIVDALGGARPREYYRSDPPGTLFGIVQGGVHREAARRVAGGARGDRLCRLAVGGLAVGESEAERTWCSKS